ncbi:hypothetical protein ACHRVZ_17415 [Flavobacterium sp. FlaQc-57]|uniref:hypothetical protein n=1 Tax=Flavobacterium sp. FlaQc-57 TaxID=3374186 RepID=UPI003757ABB4
MDSNKVLVFDNCHYFSRFLKYEFKDIKFTTGGKESLLYGSGMNKDFSLIIYVFYSEEDLIDLLRLYTYGVKLLVCNHSPKFVNKFINIKNIGVLDCLETKSGLRTDLRLYFNQAF